MLIFLWIYARPDNTLSYVISHVANELNILFIVAMCYYLCRFAIYTGLPSSEMISRTPKQTPHFDTRSEIYPSRTLAKNEIMKTFKSAQNIGNHARKCIWHCFSYEMGYLSTRLRSFTRLKARERFRRLVLR